MKNLLKLAIACSIVTALCYSCSIESTETEQFQETIVIQDSAISSFQNSCSNQQPQAQLVNNGNLTVTFTITNMEGVELYSIQSLPPGTSTNYLTFDPGNIIFNVSKNTTGISDEKVVFTMDECMSFDLELDSTNYLTSAIPILL